MGDDVPITMESLPSSIIGEVASYQDQKSYAYFSRISRRVFVGSNSPNRLLELDLKAVPSTASINLRRYTRITGCAFTLGNYNPFGVDNHAFASCHSLRVMNVYFEAANDVAAFDAII